MKKYKAVDYPALKSRQFWADITRNYREYVSS